MHLTIQQLSAQLDAALQGASRQLVNRHLSLCEECRDELAALTMQDEVLAGVLGVETHPELFELIGLEVRSAVDPNKASSLAARIGELQQVHFTFRKGLEARARQESEARRRAGLEDDLADLAARAEPESAPDDGVPEAAAPAPPKVVPPPRSTTPAPPSISELQPPAASKPTTGREPQDSKAIAVRKAIEEESARAREEARLRIEAEAKVRAEAERRALEAAVARTRSESEARARAEEEARRRAEEETRRRTEELARRKAEEAARARAEAEALERTKQETRARAEEAARRRAEEETRVKAEEEARRKAKEEARLRADAEARERAEAQARARAEEAAQRKADEEARFRAEVEARERAATEARRQAEEAARRRAEEDARRWAEQQAQLEAERETRARAEHDVSRRAEIEARIRADVEALVRAEVESLAEVDATRLARPDRALRGAARSPEPIHIKARGVGKGPNILVLLVLIALFLVTAFNLWIALENGTLARLLHRGAPAVTAESHPTAPTAAIEPAPDPKPLPIPEPKRDSTVVVAAPVDTVAKPQPPPPAPRPKHTPKPAPVVPVEVVAEPKVTTSGGSPATVIESHQWTETKVLPSPVTQVETGLLCGLVRDSDAHPVAGARVSIADVGVTVVTDRGGRFCLTAPRGDRTLTVNARGFIAYQQSLTIGRQTNELSIALRAAAPGADAPH